MSFAQGTLHFNLPITNGSDKRSWFDTNEAFIAIDATIWEAAQSAGAAATAVEVLTTQVGTLSETVRTVANAYTELSGSVNTLSEVVQGHTLNIQQLQTATANKSDSVAIADTYNPNLTYSVGDVVMYNGQRYKCITAVTTGEPFDQDKWQGEDVQTVLDDIKSDLSDMQPKALLKITGNGVKTLEAMLIECHATLSALSEEELSRVKFRTLDGLIYPYIGKISGFFAFGGVNPYTNTQIIDRLIEIGTSNGYFYSATTTFANIASASMTDYADSTIPNNTQYIELIV